jgi:hypothetical protein
MIKRFHLITNLLFLLLSKNGEMHENLITIRFTSEFHYKYGDLPQNLITSITRLSATVKDAGRVVFLKGAS